MARFLSSSQVKQTKKAHVCIWCGESCKKSAPTFKHVFAEDGMSKEQPVQESACREAFESHAKYCGLSLTMSPAIPDCYLMSDSRRAYDAFLAAWNIRKPERESGSQWKLIDSDAKQGQTIILGGWVCGEWMVTQDDWYSDRVMSDWREWSELFDEPPTHYMAFPIPPEPANTDIEVTELRETHYLIRDYLHDKERPKPVSVEVCHAALLKATKLKLGRKCTKAVLDAAKEQGAKFEYVD